MTGIPARLTIVPRSTFAFLLPLVLLAIVAEMGDLNADGVATRVAVKILRSTSRRSQTPRVIPPRRHRSYGKYIGYFVSSYSCNLYFDCRNATRSVNWVTDMASL